MEVLLQGILPYEEMGMEVVEGWEEEERGEEERELDRVDEVLLEGEVLDEVLQEELGVVDEGGWE